MSSASDRDEWKARIERALSELKESVDAPPRRDARSRSTDTRVDTTSSK